MTSTDETTDATGRKEAVEAIRYALDPAGANGELQRTLDRLAASPDEGTFVRLRTMRHAIVRLPEGGDPAPDAKPVAWLVENKNGRGRYLTFSQAEVDEFRRDGGKIITGLVPQASEHPAPPATEEPADDVLEAMAHLVPLPEDTMWAEDRQLLLAIWRAAHRGTPALQPAAARAPDGPRGRIGRMTDTPATCSLCGVVLLPRDVGPAGDPRTDCGGDCLACMQIAERPPLRLWAVYGGYGLFVVRAPNEAGAREAALHGPSLDDNLPSGSPLAEYGHGPDDIGVVLELRPDGPAGILANHYG